MFQRRMFSSGCIPRTMFSALHIQSAKQALRVLPSLVVMPTQICNTPVGVSQVTVEALRSSPAVTTSALIEELLAMMQAEMSLNGSVWCKRNLSCTLQIWPRVKTMAMATTETP